MFWNERICKENFSRSFADLFSSKIIRFRQRENKSNFIFGGGGEAHPEFEVVLPGFGDVHPGSEVGLYYLEYTRCRRKIEKKGFTEGLDPIYKEELTLDLGLTSQELITMLFQTGPSFSERGLP